MILGEFPTKTECNRHIHEATCMAESSLNITYYSAMCLEKDTLDLCNQIVTREALGEVILSHMCCCREDGCNDLVFALKCGGKYQSNAAQITVFIHIGASVVYLVMFAFLY